MRDKVTFILQHSGFQVVGTGDGRQALAEIGRERPDLVVMAEDSHRLNKDELCLLIREACQTPIVILGNDSEEAAGVEMLEMGADAYLTAPLNLRELLARVRSLLRRTKANAVKFGGG
jgi:DNA-binding response OmpR family regulator